MMSETNKIRCTITYGNNILLSNNNNKNDDEKDTEEYDEKLHGDIFHPLGNLYYSSKRNMLLTDHPSNAIEEIESFYCPQCLENYPSSEAAMYKNRCPRVECLKCPFCSTVLTTIVSHLNGYDGPQTYLSCGYCYWDSVQIDLVAKNGAELFNHMMEIEDTVDSACIVTSRIHALRETSQLIDRKTTLKDRLKQRSTTSMKTNLLLQLARLEYGKKQDTYTTWNWQDATEYEKKKEQEEIIRKKEYNKNMSLQIQNYIAEGKSLVSRQKHNKSKRRNSSSTSVSDNNNNNNNNDDDADDKKIQEKTKIKSTNDMINPMMSPPDLIYYDGNELLDKAASLESRIQQPGLITRNRNELLPQRHPLITKRTLRCRETFEDGSPGILLKPHINPLMGDTSMRTNIGNWYKKSSLAMAFYPRFTIESYDDNELLMYVINPYDEPIHIVLSNVLVINNKNDDNNIITKISNYPSNGFYIRGYDELAEQDEEWLNDDDDEDGNNKIDTSEDAQNNIVKRELNRVLISLKWQQEENQSSSSIKKTSTTIVQVKMRKKMENNDDNSINYLVKLEFGEV